jgi:nucleoside 2-deoxyribosyltransferase
MNDTQSQWIYFAAPLFTQAEINFNQSLADRLIQAGYTVYLPQKECQGMTDPDIIFATCIRGLLGANLIIIVLDGADADSGSCFEMGYAYAKGIPIIGLRTDFRGSGDHLGLNLMLTHSCDRLLLTALENKSQVDRITYLKMGEDFLPVLLQTIKLVLDRQQ